VTDTHRRPWYARTWLHIAIIMAVAAVFRLWQLDSLPPGLFGDEATDGLDALDVLAGRGSVFFPANFGREGLHMWIVAGAFRLLDVTPLALRLPSAIAGILTALAAYWLGCELITKEEERRKKENGASSFFLLSSSLIPLLAALYVATSYWHVHFSRFGIRGVFTPLCGALAFAAFWRAVNRRSTGWFAVAGFWLGLALHFYTASRFFPFFLAGFLLVEWLVARLTRRPALLPQHWRGILVLYVVAALVFAPLGLYFVQHPGSFAQRASAVTALGAESPLARMARAAVANVLQFFLPGGGDQEQFYNLPGRAVFDPVTALLALVGLGVLLWRWRSGPALFLLLWFPALLLPSFLATDRWPTLPRVLGVIPGVYFFPAVGLAAVVGWLERTSPPNPLSWLRPGEGESEGVRFIFLCLALLLHAGLTWRDYFHVWGPSQATYEAFEGDMVAAADWLDRYEDARLRHVYLSADIYRHPTFMLLHERATVQTYFTHTNPQLSWFDGRAALPLPVANTPAVYLVPASAPLAAPADAWLRAAATETDTVAGPDGAPALQVLQVAAGTSVGPGMAAAAEPVALTPQLDLTGAQLALTDGPEPELTLFWRTHGPDPADWPGYRLEVVLPARDGTEWTGELSFEAFRPLEWTVDGGFVTWHTLHGYTGPAVSGGGATGQGRLRLVRVRDSGPVATAAAPEGWHAFTFSATY